MSSLVLLYDASHMVDILGLILFTLELPFRNLEDLLLRIEVLIRD